MKQRRENNKNIQTMEQKEIDVYEILNDVECGTELYTPMCGNVELRYLQDNKEAAEAIITNTNNGSEYTFNKNGKYVEEGEVLLFPSNEMRDWSKFFKKGDVLEFAGDKGVQGTCTFENFEDETKTRFLGRFVKEKECLYYKRASSFRTADWVKSDDPAGYIRFVEERLGGKLNRETLEIEKPAFEIGKLYVFDEEDEDGNVTVIGKLIGKNESKDTLTFGNQYEIETEKFVTDQAFDLRISVHDELREATEGEYCTFKEAYTLWEKNAKKPKKPMEQPAFKTFDKVLVRDEEECEWIPALFVRDRGEEANFRYEALSIYSGKTSGFSCCIPFEGNEYLAFTSDPF
jgi:hypothetical protein